MRAFASKFALRACFLQGCQLLARVLDRVVVFATRYALNGLAVAQCVRDLSSQRRSLGGVKSFSMASQLKFRPTTRLQRVRVVTAADGWKRRWNIAQVLVAIAIARAAPLKTAYGHARQQRAKKKQKKDDDDEIRTHAILEGFTPVAEKMDFYVSHFLDA